MKASSERQTAGGWVKHLLLQMVDGAVLDAERMESEPDEAVHRLRVRMKKLEALLKLGKAALNKTVRKRLRLQVSAIKDACASHRDAAVVEELAQELGDKHGLHFVSAALVEERPQRLEIRGILQRMKREAGRITLHGLTENDVKDSYAANYKAGCQGMRKARKTDLSEDFHEWRKRVKTLYFQMAALHASVPHLRKRLERVHKLGHLLGSDHDLTMLEQQVEKQAAVSLWFAVIAKQRKRLRTRILKLGEKVYQHSPRRFAKLRRGFCGDGKAMS